MRIESANQGRHLFAFFSFHAMQLSLRIDPDSQSPRLLCWEGKAVDAEIRLQNEIPARIRELGCKFDYIDLHTAVLCVRLGSVFVVGNHDSGFYEWFVDCGDEIICSNTGYLNTSVAMRDGLAVGDADEPSHVCRIRMFQRRYGQWIEKQPAEELVEA